MKDSMLEVLEKILYQLTRPHTDNMLFHIGRVELVIEMRKKELGESNAS